MIFLCLVVLYKNKINSKFLDIYNSKTTSDNGENVLDTYQVTYDLLPMKEDNVMKFGKKDNIEYWNCVYNNIKDNKIKYDLWLDKFKDILDECKDSSIIDLGCGSGNNSLYLNERGFFIIACDYCSEALKIVNKNLPEIKTLEVDLTKNLPFRSNSTKLIIADLCLHYFDKRLTKGIFNEIRRVLVKGGYLIFRVNSIRDANYCAGKGVEIERHFYDTKYGYKRFFDKDDIRYFCDDWKIKYLSDDVINRYGMNKHTIETVIKKQ